MLVTMEFNKVFADRKSSWRRDHIIFAFLDPCEEKKTTPAGVEADKHHLTTLMKYYSRDGGAFRNMVVHCTFPTERHLVAITATAKPTYQKQSTLECFSIMSSLEYDIWISVILGAPLLVSTSSFVSFSLRLGFASGLALARSSCDKVKAPLKPIHLRLWRQWKPASFLLNLALSLHS